MRYTYKENRNYTSLIIILKQIYNKCIASISTEQSKLNIKNLLPVVVFPKTCVVYFQNNIIYLKKFN